MKKQTIYIFSHHLTTYLQPVPEQRSWNLEIENFPKFK